MRIHNANNPQTVLVDMDGVIADFDGQVVKTLRQEYPHIPIPNKRSNFYISDDFGPEYLGVIKDIQSREGFFASMPMLPFAINGLQRIINYGYTPRICTAALSNNPTCTEEKIEWLDRNLGRNLGFLAHNAIVDKNKHQYDDIALIDDRPNIPNVEFAPWTHIAFSQSYNQDGSAPLRLDGWMDHSLPRLLKEARIMYRLRKNDS